MEINSKNWVLKTADQPLVDELAGTLNISSACARLLVSRGISSADEARIFLSPRIEGLHNPFLLPDMSLAVKRIRSAFDKKDKILVYGDSDVDGITSVAVLFSAIRSLGGDGVYYTPEDESYGLKREVIERFSKEGVRLMVTVDCGISAFEEIELAKSLGLDTIVCDHHEVVGGGIPKAIAVIDPKRKDSLYPFRELAGCGVAYKLAEALMISFGKHYDKELIFLELDNGALSAIKVKNGIIVENSLDVIDEKRKNGVFEKFSAFTGQSLLVYYETEKELELFRRTFGKPLKNEFICLKELEIKYIHSESFLQETCWDSSRLLGAADGRFKNVFQKFCLFMRFEAADDLRMKYFRESQLDLLALGTIADLVPLIDENRTFVKHGLRSLNSTKKKGLLALMERCAKKENEQISARSVSWDVIPALNAAGRMGKSRVALDLLLCDDERKARSLVDEIMGLNNQRKSLQAEGTGRINSLVDAQCDTENDPILVVKEKNIHKGILGVIASQIARQYKKPAIVMLMGEGEAVGSCRSIVGLDMSAVLGKMSGLLMRHGGHSQAAGFTISVNKIEEFILKIKETVRGLIGQGAPPQELCIDSELKPAELSFEFLNEVSGLEPFGAGNPYPVFCLTDAKLAGISTVGADKSHLKLKVAREKSSAVDAVGWNMAEIAPYLSSCGLVDIAFNLETNIWQDKQNLQMKIIDIRQSEKIGSEVQ